MPIIDDIFANLSDAKIFCVLDLTGAYQQLAVSERSQIFDKIEKPVLFASSSLSPAERNYSQVHREALAVVFSVKKFHKYIYGKEFTIRSDCQALREIFSSKNVPPVAAARLQRWSVFLSMYRYKMEYKSAFNMRNADGLSRLPLKLATEIEGGSINLLKLNTDSKLPISMETIREHTIADESLCKIRLASEN